MRPGYGFDSFGARQRGRSASVATRSGFVRQLLRGLRKRFITRPRICPPETTLAQVSAPERLAESCQATYNREEHGSHGVWLRPLPEPRPTNAQTRIHCSTRLGHSGIRTVSPHHRPHPQQPRQCWRRSLLQSKSPANDHDHRTELRDRRQHQPRHGLLGRDLARPADLCRQRHGPIPLGASRRDDALQQG